MLIINKLNTRKEVNNIQDFEKSDIPPFKMYGNLYFIESSRVSVHLIDTAEGLVLIDTGYPQMYN